MHNRGRGLAGPAELLPELPVKGAAPDVADRWAKLPPISGFAKVKVPLPFE